MTRDEAGIQVTVGQPPEYDVVLVWQGSGPPAAHSLTPEAAVTVGRLVMNAGLEGQVRAMKWRRQQQEQKQEQKRAAEGAGEAL